MTSTKTANAYPRVLSWVVVEFFKQLLMFLLLSLLQKKKKKSFYEIENENNEVALNVSNGI